MNAVTQSILTGAVGASAGLLAAFASHVLQTRRDRDQAMERRTERVAQADDRRSERLNELRVALYVDLLAWVDATALTSDIDASTYRFDEPAVDLKARVDLLAGPLVRNAFETLLRKRGFVNQADHYLDDPEYGPQLRKDVGATRLQLRLGDDALRDACRDDLQVLASDYGSDESPL